jgi:hypothetical protein
MAGLFALCSAPAVAQTGTQTLFPEQLPATVELFNPLSGPITGIALSPKTLVFEPLNPKYVSIAPVPSAPLNEYGSVSWHVLEPQQGRYNYSVIANVLQACPAPPGQPLCLPAGAAFGFRIMAFNPQTGSNTNVTTGSDGYPVYSDLPAYLAVPAHGWLLPVKATDPTQGHYFIPDWNDPFFLARIKALLTALGRRFDGHQRIGWLDIGLYGSWGEWHTSGLPDAAEYTHGIPYDSSAPYYALNTQAYLQNTGKPGAYQPGTAASKAAIIDAYNAAFPRSTLLMLTDDGQGLCHALQIPGSEAHIGIRRDSLGAADWTYQFPDKLPNCDTPADQTLIANRWKTAPLVAEPFGNGSSPTFPCQTFTTDATTGAYDIDEQVPQFHVAAIQNDALCAGPWGNLSAAEQQAFQSASLQSGYRLAPVEIDLPRMTTPSADPHIKIHTHWANTGLTPTYTDWRVEFSIWTFNSTTAPAAEIVRFISGVDLRTVLPTEGTPVVVEDRFALPAGIAPGSYHLRMRVLARRHAAPPMQLALQQTTPDGAYYWLGPLTIPDFRAP